jgi:transposase
MSYIEGTQREQYILFPESIDEYITEDNPVRFIDAFISNLDLDRMGFGRTQPASTGRPAYHPADLLKLYIYGYQNGVRTSRRLERESQRNIEVMWLLRKLTPDFKTIADFRKDNRSAFKKVFSQFTLLCRQWDLFGGELVAIDGSRFKGVNSSQRNFTRAKLKRMLKSTDERIDQYLKELDEGDAREEEPRRITAAELKERIAGLKKRQKERQEMLDQIESGEKDQVSLTDSDCRRMSRNGKTEVGYNVQIVVDHKHHLIVEQEVTNEVTDRDQLGRMALQARDTLEADNLIVVADMGYSHGKEIKVCEEAGIETYVARPKTSANRKLGLYPKESFRYDRENDCYICPQGEVLTYRFDTFEQGREIRYYVGKTCRRCSMKSHCTRNKEARRLTRWVDEDLLDEVQERVKAHPEVMNKRKELVEHPFGTIKYWNDQGHFLMRGLEKVRGEFSLSALAYNMKRVMNILGVTRMVESIG